MNPSEYERLQKLVEEGDAVVALKLIDEARHRNDWMVMKKAVDLLAGDVVWLVEVDDDVTRDRMKEMNDGLVTTLKGAHDIVHMRGAHVRVVPRPRSTPDSTSRVHMTAGYYPIDDARAHLAPFGTVRACLDCGVLITGTSTICVHCGRHRDRNAAVLELQEQLRAMDDGELEATEALTRIGILDEDQGGSNG